MQFCSLGSGSGGNATLIDSGGREERRHVLIDCGFGLRELESRLTSKGRCIADLSAIFVTHEHGDHAGGALALARRYRVPIWMSRGTWLALGAPDLPDLIRFARDGEPIDLNGLTLLPFTVPHDAQEPLQLCCSDGHQRLGVLTDVGASTPHLLEALAGCDTLLLECNHDSARLAQSHYPARLKARIGGRFGHLANHQAAEILAHCWHAGLRRVVAAHLSEHNNLPELAHAALTAACPPTTEIMIANQSSGLDWLSVA